MVVVKGGKPRQANLRRALSSAYYALFHCLARDGANLVMGGTGASRSGPAWRQVYRALEHGQARKACQRSNIVNRFPNPISDFADVFVSLQEKRHEADYDPDGRFYKSAVIQEIDNAELAIQRYNASAIKDRRAFVALVLFKSRA